MIILVTKMLKTMVRLSQNGSIISEICPENILEIGHFLRKFVPENLAKFDLFLHDLSAALLE